MRQHARQNSDKGIARAFVATYGDGSQRIAGFYTLSSSHVAFQELPMDQRQGLPRYPIPAVDRQLHGQGLGSVLLIHALRKIVQVAETVGVRVVLVDAKHGQAKAYYRRFGFMELVDQPLSLFLPVHSLNTLF